MYRETHTQTTTLVYTHTHMYRCIIATQAPKQHKCPDTPTLVHLHTYMCSGNPTCPVSPYPLKATYTYKDTHKHTMSAHPTQRGELHTLTAPGNANDWTQS